MPAMTSRSRQKAEQRKRVVAMIIVFAMVAAVGATLLGILLS